VDLAFVHERLVARGARERVAATLAALYPSAPVLARAFEPASTFEDLRRANVTTTRSAARVRGVDVVVTVGDRLAHRTRLDRGVCHVAYVLPARHHDDGRWLRAVARRGVEDAHLVVAGSRADADAVKRATGRDAAVLHPGVNLDAFHIAPTTGDYFMLVGPLASARRSALAVAAFSAAGWRLVIVGDGPARRELERRAGRSVEFRGVVDDATLAALYGRCRGVIVTSGAGHPLAALEANASGRPAVALRGPGTEDAVVDGVTGILFDAAAPGALAFAVEEATRRPFAPAALRAHAERFAYAAFHERFRVLVDRSCLVCARVRRGRRPPTLVSVENPETAARPRSGVPARVVP
jgi:glycosyltransferase involved in cell wall biosynthesis